MTDEAELLDPADDTPIDPAEAAPAGSAAEPLADTPEDMLIARQIGRRPRGPWRCVARCRFGRPTVIATASLLEDGEPFPTLYWLTCPELISSLGELESAGGTAAWGSRLKADAGLARQMVGADTAYREARAAESDGEDACAGVGIAGQADPLAVKCLHAHVAALLAGIDDPVGEGVLAQVRRECSDDLCRRLTFRQQGASE
jgi:hypothetical protein